jgi:multiple sugar transport system permease protein
MRSSARFILSFAAAFTVAAYLAPIYWVAITSIKPTNAINSRIPVWDFVPTVEHYHEIFTRFDFGNALLNSAIVVIAATAITMVLSFICAYALARMKMRGADGLSLFILSLRFMPIVVVAMPFYLLYTRIGLIDSYIGLIIAYVGFGLPFAVWLLRGFMRDLPREIDEAARLDGLGWIALIRKIILPVAAPGLAVTTIFTFVFNWNEFLFALYITQSRAVTVPIAVAKMIDLYNVLWGPISAAVIIQLVPMIIVVGLLQRHMIRGLAMGAVK